ncbi:MAG: peptidylprolyl isomerase [Candidatus Competibacteraceae bacterium]|nr:peptidylprolyl isomerase [Candidatus Competibacteraceae bacterium]
MTVFSLVPLWVVQQQALAAEQGIVPATAGTGASPPSSKENEQITTPPAAGNSPAKPVQEKVLMARVGDQKITADDFMKYISQDGQLVKMSTTNQGKAQVLREMILDRLIEEGMRREGFLPKDRSPTQPDYLRGYSLLAAKYFPEANQTPDEEKIHQYYMDHQEIFGIPAMVRIGQIQFRVPANASPKDIEAVKARADETLKRLRAGESFEILAGALTENPQGKVAGGDLGFLPVKQDPWLRKAIAGLTLGQYSEVLESPVGYEIIQLKDKRDALLTPYANARKAVLARMRLEANRQGREAYAWRLAKEVGVTVEIDELKGAIP